MAKSIYANVWVWLNQDLNKKFDTANKFSRNERNRQVHHNMLI